MKRLIILSIVVFACEPASAEIKLKQSTATQRVPLGYFVDPADGKTGKTALTIAVTDIKLWKAGSTSLVQKNSGGATHMADGVYYAVLDATDTNTVGPLVIFVNQADALPIRVECEVLPAALFDAWQAGTLPVNVTQFGGAAGAFASGKPEVNTTNWDGTAVASANVRADVRQFGGANGIFASGRPEVTTSATSNAAIAAAVDADRALVSATVQAADGQTAFDIDQQSFNGTLTPGATVIVYDTSDSGLPNTRRLVSFQGATGALVIDSAPDFTVEVGDTVKIFAAPPGLLAIKAKTDFLPSATAGAAGGVFIAGSNANTSVNITGNLSGSVGSVTAPVTTSTASN
jgi:hypothetical protein